jgi:hypothetical protein
MDGTKLELPNVTAVCADCVDANRAIHVVERCKTLCNFAEIKLLTSLETEYPHTVIRPLNSINDYSAFILKCITEYVNTSHMLIVQHDGWVLNPGTWDESWLQYDYIGPLYIQETEVNDWSVGSGGFSLRSKALMAAVAELLPPWDGSASWSGPDGKNSWGHEDGIVSKSLRGALMNRGFKFAPPDVAVKFADGGNAHYPRCRQPFGFHGFWPQIMEIPEVRRQLVLMREERTIDGYMDYERKYNLHRKD